MIPQPNRQSNSNHFNSATERVSFFSSRCNLFNNFCLDFLIYTIHWTFFTNLPSDFYVSKKFIRVNTPHPFYVAKNIYSKMREQNLNQRSGCYPCSSFSCTCPL